MPLSEYLQNSLIPDSERVGLEFILAEHQARKAAGIDIPEPHVSFPDDSDPHTAVEIIPDPTAD